MMTRKYIWSNVDVKATYNNKARELMSNLKDYIDTEGRISKNWESDITQTMGEAIEDTYQIAFDQAEDETLSECYAMNVDITDEELIEIIDRDEGKYKYILNPSENVRNYYNMKYKL